MNQFCPFLNSSAISAVRIRMCNRVRPKWCWAVGTRRNCDRDRHRHTALVLVTGILVLGTLFLVLVIGVLVLVIGILVLGTLFLVFVIGILVLCTWYLVLMIGILVWQDRPSQSMWVVPTLYLHPPKNSFCHHHVLSIKEYNPAEFYICQGSLGDTSI